jgi:POPLD (NUC188) domain
LDSRRGKGQIAEPHSFASILLIQIPPHNGIGAGYRIIIPSGWALPFWLPLVQNGGHTVGVRDMELLARQEIGRPVFPADYPDTASGQKFLKARATRLVEKWVAHPIAKRTPYFLGVGEGSPFFPTAPPVMAGSPCLRWSNGVASTLVLVSIQMVARGSVQSNASLYSRELSQEEVDSLVVLDVPNSIERNEATLQHWNGSTVAVEATLSVRIGVAFGGGVSMLRGFGYGIGFVDSRALATSTKGKIWLRNLNSKHCYPAIATPIKL